MTSRLGVRLFLVTAVLLRGIMDTSSWIFSTFNICQLTLSVCLSVCQCPVDVPAGRPTGRPEAHGRRRQPAGAPRTDG